MDKGEKGGKGGFRPNAGLLKKCSTCSGYHFTSSGFLHTIKTNHSINHKLLKLH